MKQFLPEATKSERTSALEENASKVEVTKYQKPLTEDELIQRREMFVDNAIKVSQKEDELKEIKDTFKSEIDPIKAVNKVLQAEIKTRQQTVEGTIYHLANHEDGMMETYDHEGIMISSRRLRPDERQGGIFQLKKAN